MSGPVVRTTLGSVRGARREHGAAFLGIPFAQAPVGDRRFGAPEPPAPWIGVRAALEYGPTTDRVLVPDHPMPETVVPGPDTLNLNVFTPGPGPAAGGTRPVLFWIHGGGFLAGSPKNRWYEGDAFVRDDVVVVTVDYRLGFDGFGLVEGAPHNRGVLDWIAALEWVRDNIGAFGGDPARVTVAGQSAGGGAVLMLLGIPRAQPLFRAAISLSGAIEDVPRARAAKFAADLARTAGVGRDRAGFSSIPEEALFAAQKKLLEGSPGRVLRNYRALVTGSMPIGGMIDGELLPQRTLSSMATGTGADKPTLVVTADQEMTSGFLQVLPAAVDRFPRVLALRMIGLPRTVARSFAARYPELGTRAIVGQLFSDTVFRRLALRVAEARGPAATWLARFAWPSAMTGDALHGIDMPFFFDILRDPSCAAWVGPNPPQALADELHGVALAVLRGDEPGWERWTPERGTTRILDAVSRTVPHGYAEALCRVPAPGATPGPDDAAPPAVPSHLPLP